MHFTTYLAYFTVNTPLNLHINGHTEESRKSPIDKTDDDDDDIDDDNLSEEEDDKSAGKLLFIFNECQCL